MNGTGTVRTRRKPNVMLLLGMLLGVFLVAGSAVLASPVSAGGSLVATHQEPASKVHVSVVHPAAIGAAQLYINRSQSAGTYVKEFVSLNNSTTLTILPLNGGTATTFHGCEWVTVVNATTTISGDAFHTVRYAKVTDGNNTGTLVQGQAKASFDACAGNAYFVDYTYWTYSIYDFTAKVLGTNSTLSVTTGRYPATANAWPGNFTVAIGPKTVAVVKIASNLSFNVSATSPVDGATTCTASSFSQLCSFPEWTFSLFDQAASGTSVTTNPIVFGGLTGITLVTGTYSNWTVTYTETNVSANTATGAFFLNLESWLSLIFVDFWYVWLLLIVVVVVYYGATHRGGSRSRRQ